MSLPGNQGTPYMEMSGIGHVRQGTEILITTNITSAEALSMSDGRKITIIYSTPCLDDGLVTE